LVFLALASAFTALLLAGCGSGGGADNGAKVEASLQAWFGTVAPEDTAFPQGAGVVPRVTAKSCKDQHAQPPTTVGKKLEMWSCVVKFGAVAMTVSVAVDDSTKVVLALPNPGAGLPPSTVTLPPARTYTGGP
jgi:hypothetical protein